MSATTEHGMSRAAGSEIDPEVRESMPTVAGYLSRDRGHIPDALFEQSSDDLGNAPIDKAAFTSREFHELEKQHLWKKTWLMACRENDIPEVGDRVVFDIVDQSIVVVRSGPGEAEFTAFHNACMHRGTRLVDADAGDALSGPTLNCSFHKWSYHLDGRIKQIPCRWDFPAVADGDVRLSTVRVEAWNGFVFVNLDADAEQLADFIGPTIARHFENWPRDTAWKAAHVGKVIPCNWKLATEAFLEVYHTVATHPGLLAYAGDCNAQYDYWGRHGRMLSCVGVPSPHLGTVTDPQTIVDGMLGDSIGNIFGDGEADIPQLPPGATLQDARELCADLIRSAMGAQTGADFSQASDSEMLDGVQYFVFPNLIPWAGNAFPMCYRVRPNGDDHESCVFEAMVLMFMPDEAPRPKDAPLRMLGTDEPWAAAVELGGLGPVLDQDMVNLTKIQRGLRSDGISHVHFANYQERNIRNLHENLGRLLGLG